MDIAQRNQIRQWIHETLVHLGDLHIENNLVVEFNNDFTRRMGDATRRPDGKYQVRFSVPLWPLASEVDRKETVIHEICHIVDIARGTYRRGDGHGYSWKRLMVECGIEPKRCHDVERPPEMKRKVQRFEAKCSCMTHEITSHLRTKMLKGFRYRCRKCGTSMGLVN